MKVTILMIVAGFLISAGLPDANATETGSIICDGGIVSIGDTAGEVIAKCGSPATSSKREDKRVEKDSQNSRGKKISTVSIDDWIFNFGPNQFQQEVILENGKVARIESLGYGY